MMAVTGSKYKEMVKKGFKVVKIDIDIEELIEWCRFQKLTVNPESRTRYCLENSKL
jgi:hypothetical protein